MKIKDIETALEIFEEACIKHSEATEQGDYKTANKYYAKIIKAATFLKSENAISNLKDYLSSSFVGIRLWAACYWLAVNEQEGIEVLEEIVKSTGIHSLTAETTLSEWKKGNLKF
ncbi:DUF2019 domain-containing protein [Sphingobacterium sp. DN00404]|uniref:DUF2019 domain-containing protein n=1 Tax=Sphingobacterium micropteri TaxID=2763501 RepID=A0ABR7YMX9_9SPHI|nr:DUF2019 domain-containing protein [Sphingobacterium micropteri]MBD1432699.1 DUF2019 domain-containing protein [Sphingobacterium micropteri]